MKSEKKIFTAFILNLVFSVFELTGGIFSGSTAIISDSLHDLGDAVSIGISYLLEKKSKMQPDKKYTYGYTRYSVLGSAVTTLILLLGSAAVIYNAVIRMIDPAEINYNGMIVLAVIGVIVNSCAVFFTGGGSSLNQKAVNLHMLEDVLGWIVVLAGAVVMKFTDFSLIDPIMSVGVAVFIFVNAAGNFRKIIDIFLEKTPVGMDVDEIRAHILCIDGVLDVHHIHIWSMDGQNHYATVHVAADGAFCEIKERVREELREHGISHVTIETEAEDDQCGHRLCQSEYRKEPGHHHRHYYH